MTIIIFQRFLVLSLTLAAACLTVAGQERNLCADEQPYEYQTRLIGGYRIVFETDGKEFKSLYLYRGSLRKAELSGVSCGMPHKNLGYVGVDFRNYFVLVQSFGAGNPHWIQLIRKSDGKNRVKAYSAWIDADVGRGLLMYSERKVPHLGDKFAILNVRTFRTEQYRFPDDIFGEPEVLNRIQDVIVNRSTVVVKYRVGRQVRIKRYRRHR